MTEPMSDRDIADLLQRQRIGLEAFELPGSKSFRSFCDEHQRRESILFPRVDGVGKRTKRSKGIIFNGPTGMPTHSLQETTRTFDDGTVIGSEDEPEEYGISETGIEGEHPRDTLERGFWEEFKWRLLGGSSIYWMPGCERWTIRQSRVYPKGITSVVFDTYFYVFAPAEFYLLNPEGYAVREDGMLVRGKWIPIKL